MLMAAVDGSLLLTFTGRIGMHWVSHPRMQPGDGPYDDCVQGINPNGTQHFSGRDQCSSDVQKNSHIPLRDLRTTCPLTGLRRYPYLGTHVCTVMSTTPAAACCLNNVLAHPCAFL